MSSKGYFLLRGITHKKDRDRLFPKQYRIIAHDAYRKDNRGLRAVRLKVGRFST